MRGKPPNRRYDCPNEPVRERPAIGFIAECLHSCRCGLFEQRRQLQPALFETGDFICKSFQPAARIGHFGWRYGRGQQRFQACFLGFDAGHAQLVLFQLAFERPGLRGQLLALERTSDLLRSATSQVLRFKLDGDLPPAVAAIARVTGRIVQLPVHNAVEIENHLATLRTAGLVVEDVEIRQADLEDVFLEVMNRKQTASGALA